MSSVISAILLQPRRITAKQQSWGTFASRWQRTGCARRAVNKGSREE